MSIKLRKTKAKYDLKEEKNEIYLKAEVSEAKVFAKVVKVEAGRFISSLYRGMKKNDKINHINEYYEFLYDCKHDEKNQKWQMDLSEKISAEFKKLDVENQSIEFDILIKWVMNKEKLAKQGFIKDIWTATKGEVQLEKLNQIINIVLESSDDLITKKENIEEIIGKIDENAILNEFKKYVSQIEKINIGIDKADIYYKALNLCLKEENEEKFNEMADIVMESLKKDKNYKDLDLSNRENFINSMVCLDLTKSGIENWNQKDEKEKSNIEKKIIGIINQDYEQAIKNDAVFKFYDSVAHGMIEPSDELKSALNVMIDALHYPEKISEYDNIIEKGEQINDDEISEFLKNVELYRIKNGRIPKKYYDYIIRETIKENIDCSNRVVREAIVDFGLDYLDELGIQGYNISFSNLKEGLGGEHIENSITLSQRYFEQGNEISTINTITHEIRHAYQDQQMKNSDNYDPKFYRMLKEQIIRLNIMEFYSDNYRDMEIEFDARMHASIRTYEYLIDIGVPVDIIAEKEDTIILWRDSTRTAKRVKSE